MYPLYVRTGVSNCCDSSRFAYWNTKASKNKSIDTSLLFDSDEESAQSDGSDSDSGTERNHILGIEDEFLLVLNMQLHLGLTNLDFAIRLRVSEAIVSKYLSHGSTSCTSASMLSKCGPIGGLYWITCPENSKMNK